MESFDNRFTSQVDFKCNEQDISQLDLHPYLTPIFPLWLCGTTKKGWTSEEI